MDVDRFWQIVAQSRADADPNSPDGNMDRQVDRLTRILSDLPPQEVVEFDRHFTTYWLNAYRWDLWAAAYIIEGGCSGDGFMDFRSWLISMGRDVYEQAMGDPESLVVHAVDPTVEVCSFEEFQYVANKVYGEPIDHGLVHPGEPAGEPWEEDGDDLKRRFPRLWAKFGDE